MTLSAVDRRIRSRIRSLLGSDSEERRQAMSTDQVVSDGARELFVGRLVPQETLVALADYTPFYIYDLATVQRRYRELTTALPPQVRVYYAIKANPSLRLVQELTALGAGMEIASAGELAVAERLGISGDRVLFTGPAKTDDELAASVRYGLRTINVESLGEAQRLDAIVAAEAQHADSLRRRRPILLRVNARFEVHDADAAVQLGGGAQKFGVDEEQLDDVLPQILKLRHLDLQGVHVFAATGVLESTLLVEYTRHVFDLVQRLERDYRQCFPVVDLGGGTLDLSLVALEGPLCIQPARPHRHIRIRRQGDRAGARALLGRRGWHLRRARARREALAGDGLCPGGRWDESLPAPGSGPAGPSGDVAASRYRIGVRHRRGS